MWNNVVRFVYIAICLSGLQDSARLPLPPHLATGGCWQFLTNVALFFTCIAVGSRIAIDVANKKLWYYDQLDSMVTVAMLACAHLEFVVTVAYWVMLWVFPYLLNVDSFEVSLLLDLKIHLFPYIFLTIDASWNRYRSRRHSILVAEAVLVVYWAVIEAHMWWCRGDGVTKFPYPFLSNASMGKRLVLLVLFGSLAAADYFAKKTFRRR